jgi:3-ketoacyl-CoA synthase
MMVVVAGLVVLYLIYRRKVTIYLLDFACYRPPNSYRLTKSMFVENIFLGDMDADSIAFQIKILEKSGFSEETSVPPSLTRISPRKSLSFAMEEAVMVMCSAVTELFQKTNINPKAIDILISNSSMFCPTPSLSAVVINKFRMRSNVMSFHLSGMGCSAGIIAVDLAKDVLRVHRNSLALIVSTETLLLNWYTGKNPSMLITNCLFRMGGAAVLLSNRKQDKSRAKYELKHLVRTNKAQDDLSHTCVIQDVDSENMVGVSISKNIVNVAGLSIICQKIKWNARRSSTYVPDFKKAFEHFCIHAGGRAVIQAIEKNLRLRKQDVEPSKMTLYKFGNTSSSSIWYELCYIEAKGRMKRGDRVWQIGFGSGFKCNSAVWKCVYNSEFEIANAWSDIYSYPVEVPNVGKIN